MRTAHRGLEDRAAVAWTLEPQELKRFVSVDELNSFILAVRPLVEVRPVRRSSAQAR